MRRGEDDTTYDVILAVTVTFIPALCSSKFGDDAMAMHVKYSESPRTVWTAILSLRIYRPPFSATDLFPMLCPFAAHYHFPKPNLAQ